MDFVLERSTVGMRRAWTTDAGLPWTSQMDSRDRSDTGARTLIRSANTYVISGSVLQHLSGVNPHAALARAVSNDAALNNTPGLGGRDYSEGEARARGYWELTKVRTRDEIDAHHPWSHLLAHQTRIEHHHPCSHASPWPDADRTPPPLVPPPSAHQPWSQTLIEHHPLVPLCLLTIPGPPSFFGRSSSTAS
jgi:hypothetical protein